MTRSIRNELFLHLLLCVSLIVSLAVMTHLILEHHNQVKQIDVQLSFSSLRFDAFLPLVKLDESKLQHMQETIDRMPLQSETILNQVGIHNSHQFIRPKFQIWHHDRLLLKSADLPNENMASTHLTFATQSVGGATWRTFTRRNSNTGITIVVAENYQLLHHLENRMTQSSILVLLLSYPLLMGLIWLIVTRGLRSISSITARIKNLAPNQLSQIDISHTPQEIHPLLEQLNHLLSKLNRAFTREKRFASEAAHELRTPLAALSTQTQLALKSKDQASKDQVLRAILKSANRSAHIIDQLLTLSRMEADANTSPTQQIDLAYHASEVVQELAPLALKKQISIEVQAMHPPYGIMGYAAAIHILLRNLVDNAIKYCPPSSHICLRICHLDQGISCDVIDNGPGIDTAHHQRVFDRFHRLTGESQPGCGLGLSIVQEIMTIHHAQITLQKPCDHSGLQVSLLFPTRKT